MRAQAPPQPCPVQRCCAQGHCNWQPSLALRGIGRVLKCCELPGEGQWERSGTRGAVRATSPGSGSTPGLQNTDTPCHIARVGVTSPTGYGYTG